MDLRREWAPSPRVNLRRSAKPLSPLALLIRRGRFFGCAAQLRFRRVGRQIVLQKRTRSGMVDVHSLIILASGQGRLKTHWSPHAEEFPESGHTNQQGVAILLRLQGLPLNN